MDHVANCPYERKFKTKNTIYANKSNIDFSKIIHDSE